MSKIIFPADQEITCLNGHVIGVVKSDIEEGAYVNFNQMRWNQPHPQPGDKHSTVVCTDCGTPWLQIDARTGPHFHTPDGWMPRYPAK